MEMGNVKVREVMSTDIVSITPGSTVSDAASKMISSNVHQLPVVEKEQVVGMLTYKDIVEGRAKVDAKVANFYTKVQALGSDDTIGDAAKKMMELDTKALPVAEKNHIVGVISSTDIIPLIGKAGIKDKVDTVMTDPITIDREDDIGHAKSLMHDHDISILPMVENDGKLFGAIELFDLLKTLKPKEGMGSMDSGGDTMTDSQVKASTLVSKPTTVSIDETLSSIANIMGKNGASSVIVEDDNVPLGIVSQKDMLELIASSEQKGVYVQITNLTDVDDFAREKIDDIIKDTVQKMGQILDPQSLFLHIKTHDKGGRTKYSIRARLQAGGKTYSSKAWGWKILQTITEVMQQLERTAIEHKERSIDRRRNR